MHRGCFRAVGVGVLDDPRIMRRGWLHGVVPTLAVARGHGAMLAGGY